MSVFFPIHCPAYLRSAEMTEVMMNAPSMDEIGLNPRKDGLSYQIFPDPSDFDRYCKLKDRLPSIVVEPTEGDVESGQEKQRWNSKALSGGLLLGWNRIAERTKLPFSRKASA
ncbi:protein LBH [Alligator mississippiensis]|uniref:Protein LBH n=1 Tax=Alligator mississippiensis TaxID=8496 RepID=A0A151P381_ALLMI|nr:protein LBH [Alligator mississippiensis]